MIAALTTLSIGIHTAKENKDLAHVMLPMGNLALAGQHTPTVIICPPNALQVWQKEVEETFQRVTFTHRLQIDKEVAATNNP